MILRVLADPMKIENFTGDNPYFLMIMTGNLE